MRTCPICCRTYSDLVSQCPNCGSDLTGLAAPGITVDTAQNQTTATQQVAAQVSMPVNPGGSAGKDNSGVWKITAGIFILISLVFAALYLDKYEECKEMERQSQILREYDDSEDRYSIEVTDCYNSDDEYNWISYSLSAEELDCITIKWDIKDHTEAWSDMLYVDVITPDGEVFECNPEQDGHTWKIDPWDTIGSTLSWQGWFRDVWEGGTYRVVFYQGDRAVDAYNILVH